MLLSSQQMEGVEGEEREDWRRIRRRRWSGHTFHPPPWQSHSPCARWVLELSRVSGTIIRTIIADRDTCSAKTRSSPSHNIPLYFPAPALSLVNKLFVSSFFLQLSSFIHASLHPCPKY